MTWTHGRHLTRFGFDMRAHQQNAFRDVLARGLISFTGFTGNGLAEALQGVPTVTSVSNVDNYQHMRTKSYNFFAQDQWKLAPNATLTLGLRYEFNQPPYDAENRATLFDQSTRSLVRLGSNGAPRGAYLADKNNFAPRIGLAITPFGQNTVIRAGYGFYYDQSPTAPVEGIYFNRPYFKLNT